MNIQTFNNDLYTISELYSSSLQLKRSLNAFGKQNIKQALMSACAIAEQTGYVKQKFLLELINKKEFQDTSNKIPLSIENQSTTHYKNFTINQVLPFQKISFSALLGTLLKGLNTADTNSNQISNSHPITEKDEFLQIIKLIVMILRSELKIIQLRKRLVTMIELYIPMAQKNLTIQELKDYLLLGKIVNSSKINPHSVLLAINGHGGSPNLLEFQFYNNKKPNQQKQNYNKKNGSSQEDQVSCIQKIQQIMLRLNKRIDNFGNQWLINRSEIISKPLDHDKNNKSYKS